MILHDYVILHSHVDSSSNKKNPIDITRRNVFLANGTQNDDDIKQIYWSHLNLNIWDFDDLILWLSN